MLKQLIFFIPAIFLSLQVGANSYTIDDQKVNALMESAVEMSFSITADSWTAHAPLQTGAFLSQKNSTTAVVLALLLGELGVHRLYLGTTMGVFLTYVITLGGCGSLWLVDSMLLVIAILDDAPIDAFVNNPSLFMWMK